MNPRACTCAQPARVCLESPYAGDIEANVTYARAALSDSLRRGECPIASHLLYTQPGVLRDDVPEERRRGIEAGLAWGALADASMFYMDCGTSPGMEQGEQRARDEGRAIIQRWLDGREIIVAHAWRCAGANATGWAPTCDHDAPVRPSVILDPFSGTGTTGAAARTLGRDYIGIDLQREHTKTAERRLKLRREMAPIEGPLFSGEAEA